jgi:hypothetical protein
MSGQQSLETSTKKCQNFYDGPEKFGRPFLRQLKGSKTDDGKLPFNPKSARKNGIFLIKKGQIFTSQNQGSAT